MVQLAGQLEDEGHVEAASEMYRAAMAAGGPSAEICFLLAELLYQMHDLTGARERYYMAIELDEDYVEARANLGCVLAELGELDLAIAAFEGALAYHDDYPDVHYHLGRMLDEVGRSDEAESHWQCLFAARAEQPLGRRSARAAGPLAGCRAALALSGISVENRRRNCLRAGQFAPRRARPTPCKSGLIAYPSGCARGTGVAFGLRAAGIRQTAGLSIREPSRRGQSIPRHRQIGTVPRFGQA